MIPESRQPGLAARMQRYAHLAWSTKTFWLVPIVIAVLLALALAVAGGRAPLQPFVYHQF
jgi:hypothetical protein